MARSSVRRPTAARHVVNARPDMPCRSRTTQACSICCLASCRMWASRQAAQPPASCRCRQRATTILALRRSSLVRVAASRHDRQARLSTPPRSIWTQRARHARLSLPTATRERQSCHAAVRRHCSMRCIAAASWPRLACWAPTRSRQVRRHAASWRLAMAARQRCTLSLPAQRRWVAASQARRCARRSVAALLWARAAPQRASRAWRRACCCHTARVVWLQTVQKCWSALASLAAACAAAQRQAVKRPATVRPRQCVMAAIPRCCLALESAVPRRQACMGQAGHGEARLCRVQDLLRRNNPRPSP